MEWRAPPVCQTGLGNRSSRCLLRPLGPQKQVPQPSCLRPYWHYGSCSWELAPGGRCLNCNSSCFIAATWRVEPVGFNADEAHNIVKECVDGVLGGEDYNQNNINQWTASIVEQSLTHLVKLGKAYKYIVTCAVVQRSAYGFHTASSCFWDTTSDGTCTVRWENRTMNCIVNVFAIAIVL
ncbi:dynein light chain Tctex-type 3 [Fukomys damarensis]|uniref:dynein light chain Tctex-type 3 n=1 Tax=Fukomys damarensis TaxID=885580 RepID=UPI00053F6A0F|nr:dynein light chain Tctex-type 3 [Fukomys damarensis]